MIRYERQQELMKIMQQKHFSTVEELSRLLYASPSSVRRDIEMLQKQGLLEKIYGGVVVAEHHNDPVPMALRESANVTEKDRIAHEAAALVQPGSTILLDESSTVCHMARYLHRIPNLKIITNNLQLLSEEWEEQHTVVYATGGRLVRQNNALMGEATERFLQGIWADQFFFSARALSDDGIVSDVMEEGVRLRHIMLRCARERIMLCDSSKLGQRCTFFLCRTEEVDRILCDIPVSFPTATSPAT